MHRELCDFMNCWNDLNLHFEHCTSTADLKPARRLKLSKSRY